MFISTRTAGDLVLKFHWKCEMQNAKCEMRNVKCEMPGIASQFIFPIQPWHLQF